MTPLFVPLPGNESLAVSLANAIEGEVGALSIRNFPDGETYLRYDTPPAGRAVVLVCSLDRPDSKFLPLLFAAASARDLGAGSVGLAAPYLAYMRQDRRFRAGEAVTSRYFAEALSSQVNWLVAVDPHLHRYRSLDEVYSVPATTLHTAPLLSAWIKAEVERPLLIGPDAESEQWVAAVAQDANAPYVILEKTRRGDRDVEISVPQIDRWRDRTPVLVDDIVSTGHTLIETMVVLRQASMQVPVCIAVHGIFAKDAFAKLVGAGASRIVTTNTIPHESNAIDVTDLLAQAIQDLLSRH